MKIIYQWTGEYRVPEGGEWFFDPELGPVRVLEHFALVKHFILDRQEIPDLEEAQDDGKD